LEVMRGPKESGFKDFRSHPTGRIDPEGPGYDEWVVRRNLQQKNHHLRNSPFGVGFHEPKFKKQWIWNRYPVAFTRIFVTSCLLVFFSKPIYDIFLGPPPSPQALERAEFLKKQMQKSGWWDGPPMPWSKKKVTSED